MIPCIECKAEKPFLQLGWCQQDICAACLKAHFVKCEWCRENKFKETQAKVGP